MTVESRTPDARLYAEHFGKRLRLLRVNLSVSQAEFAVLLGVNPNCISRLERGANGAVSLECQARLVPLCAKERVPLDWLYNGVGVMQLPPKEPAP